MPERSENDFKKHDIFVMKDQLALMCIWAKVLISLHFIIVKNATKPSAGNAWKRTRSRNSLSSPSHVAVHALSSMSRRPKTTCVCKIQEATRRTTNQMMTRTKVQTMTLLRRQEAPVDPKAQAPSDLPHRGRQPDTRNVNQSPVPSRKTPTIRENAHAQNNHSPTANKRLMTKSLREWFWMSSETQEGSSQITHGLHT